MFCEKFLRVLTLFHIILQIHAVWNPDAEHVRKSLEELGEVTNYKGCDVISKGSSVRNNICHLGTTLQPPLFTITDPNNGDATIKVEIKMEWVDVQLKPYAKLYDGQSSSGLSEDVFPVITRNTPVIYCGSSTNGLQYYFGQGPEVNSIAVYRRVANDLATAKVVGMFSQVQF